ncbi:MAG: CHAD domain-containing protein [Capsulimonadaceae bacterium]
MIKSPYSIPADVSFLEAARLSIRTQAEELQKNLPGTRSGDVDALHDMRVASRRLRAVMSVFAAAFPERIFRALEREAARVTDALGAVRDADVQIEYLVGLRDAASVVEQVGLESLVARVTRTRDRDRNRLVAEIDRLARSRFWRDLEQMVGNADCVEKGEAHG